MDEAGIAQFVRDNNIGLVGIGAMTRMIAKAYRMADAVRATGVPVVMGGPHVTEMADEALGRDGGPRHADAVALGEADATWPQIVNDAARGQLKDVYAPVDAFGQESKPSLKDYPVIPWQSIDLKQFNLVPKAASSLLQKIGEGWGSFRIIPVESGTGLSVRLRVLHGHGIFRRLDSFPHQRERGQRTAPVEGPRPQLKRARSRFSSSTTISPSTSSARNRCCATSSPPARKCIGWRRSAPTCCATKNWWT
jgi:hypothetical protein